MESSPLADIDRALAALGVDESRIAEILASHRANGHSLAEIDAELSALAEGVALPAGVPGELDDDTGPSTDRPPPSSLDDFQLDDTFGSMPPPPPEVEIAEAPTRDLPQPDVAITEATTGSLPTVASQPPPDPGLSVDALFDEALAATAPPAAEVVLGEEQEESDEPMDLGLPVNVSDELAALLEGELDPREFDAGAPAAAASGDGDLAAMLEPDAAVDLEMADVELIADDELGGEDHTVVASPSAMPPPPPSASRAPPPSPSQAPPPSPSQPPPEEGDGKKGFFRKMFGK